jgi:Family of unknown function (DUF6056)
MPQIEKPFSLERQTIDDRFARWALWLPILIIAPFGILIYCAFPHSDDLCFAATWRDIGVIAMLRALYVSFQGRLFSFVATVVPFMVHESLGIDLLLAFRVFCAAALAATVALALWGCNAILPECAKPVRLLLGLTLAAALVAGSPQPEDLLYWATGIGFYSIAALVSLWMMIWLHVRAVRKAPLAPYTVAALMAVGLLIALTSEISGPVLAVIVLASLLQRFLIPGAPRQPLAHALIIGAIAIGVIVELSSPGNAMRMRVMGTDQGIALRALIGLPMAIGHVAQFLVRRLTNPALLAWLVVLVLAVPARDQAPQDVPAARRSLLAWLPLMTAMIGIYGSLYIGHVSTGDLLPQRTLNQLHFVLVGGLSLTAIALSRAFGQSVWGTIGARWPSLDHRQLAVAALLLMLATPHFLRAIQILPHIESLHRLAESRFAQFGEGKLPGAPIADRELVLPASSAEEIGWFGDPVSSSPDAWINGCVARYVGVRSVRTEPR